MVSPDRHAEWAPRPAVVGVVWTLALASVLWTVLGDTIAGRLLTGVATIGLGLLALSGTLARPTLAANEQGVVIRRLGARHCWPWHAVRVRVTRSRRLGRETSMLELDGLDINGTERFAVLGWLDLGTEPERVAAMLHVLQPGPDEP